MSHIDIVTPEPLAHPSSLLATAHLFGLGTPSQSELKILEFDCGDGGNLISIAATLPDSDCLGIAESADAIEHGSRLAKEAGLKNVKLTTGNISSIPRDGVYDIILLKNIYSRTSPGKRAALLTRASSHLGENGIILVDQICLPGWSFKEPIRKQIQYHLRNEEDSLQRVIKGRQFLLALAASVPDHLGLYQTLVRSEKDISSQIPDLNFSVEYLSDSIQPSHFHEFAEVLDEAGLHYVAEAELETMMINRFPAAIAAILPENSSLVESEQYIDFITNRSRRFSIVCPKTEPVERQLEPERIKSLYFSMYSAPVDAAAVMAESETSLTGPTGSIVTLTTKSSKAALLVLSENAPARMSFEEITTKVSDRTGDLTEADIKSIAEALSAGAVSGMVKINCNEGAWSRLTSDSPTASSLVRAQAAAAMPYVSSLQHRTIEIDQVAGRLLQLLDGKNGKEKLISTLVEMISIGELSAETPEGEKIEDPEKVEQIAAQQVDLFLARFATSGLLIG
ncbi:MAG: methyltransferase regulatory domain-containing protein [Verrucomicrobiales bacterium]|nr:methyltransferase regulatory domain-containing protein [Verrucomicrobiales bacterium]